MLYTKICKDSSSVVNHLVRSNEKQSNNTVVAFVYCNYKEERHTASNLMGSILQQVASRESTAFPKQLHKEFIELHTQYVNKYLETKERPPVNDFTNILKERLPSFSRTYIVVDALDECLEWEILQEEIKSLATENVSVLITSRHIKGIEELFGAEAKIPISASDLDVRAFLKGKQPQQELSIRSNHRGWCVRSNNEKATVSSSCRERCYVNQTNYRYNCHKDSGHVSFSMGT